MQRLLWKNRNDFKIDEQSFVLFFMSLFFFTFIFLCSSPRFFLYFNKDIQINQFNLNQDWIDEKTIVVLNKVDLINDKNELKKQVFVFF